MTDPIGFCPKCDTPIHNAADIFCPGCQTNLSKHKKLNAKPRDKFQKFNEKAGKIGSNMILFVTIPILILFFLFICMSFYR